MAAELVPASQVDDSSFQGEFYWVQCHQTQGTALNRVAIHRHVQSHYWRRKKRDESRLLRESTELPSTCASKRGTNGAVLAQKTCAGQPTVRRHSPSIDDGQSEGGSPQGDDCEVEQVQVRQRAYGALTILRKGQSDPFNVLAIPVNSRVNFLMTFCRDIELPSIHRNPANPKGLYSLEAWTSIVDSFKEPYTAYAHLTRVAAAIPVASNTKSDLTILATTFRCKSIALLRQKMVEKDALRDKRVFGAIASMLYADMYSDDVVGALSHAKMLAHMLQSGAVIMSGRRTFEAIYCDCQRAIMSFTPPCFDYRMWIPRFFAPTWLRVRETLPTSITHIAVTGGLDTTVDDDQLQKIFISMRHLQEVLNLAHVDVEFQSDAVRAYLPSSMVLAMGQLLNHYFDKITHLNECKVQNALIGKRATRARVQAVLCLALLYWTRVVSWLDSFVIGEHKMIFAANASILRRLRDTYAEYDTFASGDAIKRYSRCMLWALYVGAWAEQMQTLKNDGYSLEEEWFGPRLGALASKMGLRSWKEVREVLLGFVHNDSLSPNGSVWFHKVLKLERMEAPTPADGTRR